MSADERREGGFEHDGRFYPWRFSELGKDLMLVDRIAGVSIFEFGDAAGEGFGQMRPAIFLTLIATSLRAGNPDWSVERIIRMVEQLDVFKDVTLVGGEEEPEAPLAETPPSSGDDSRSTSNGSSSSPTPTAATSAPVLEVWSETPL